LNSCQGFTGWQIAICGALRRGRGLGLRPARCGPSRAPARPRSSVAAATFSHERAARTCTAGGCMSVPLAAGLLPLAAPAGMVRRPGT